MLGVQVVRRQVLVELRVSHGVRHELRVFVRGGGKGLLLVEAALLELCHRKVAAVVMVLSLMDEEFLVKLANHRNELLLIII